MFSIALIRELYTHMEWADSKVWRTALGSPAAGADSRLCDSLYHLHMTQRAFLQVWTRAPRFPDQQFTRLPDLYTWMRPYYREVAAYLATVDEPRLDAQAPVPWAKLFTKPEPPGGTTLGETLFQVTSHSTYHRGQVNTRLRELGATPPLVDYIGWLWLGRPHPAWPDA
ncbi:MAG TPA: DinB family protein [Gemmatimonadales bacterium]|nr:DinB family protein [Gemmatimonadales bacterium]